MKAENNEITLTGKIVAGSMEKTITYVIDEREMATYPSPSLLGLKWQAGDTVEIAIRRIPRLTSD